MTAIDLPTDIVDRKVYDSAIQALKDARVVLPRLSDLADPAAMNKDLLAATQGVEPDAPHAANLYRVHWFNDAARKNRTDVPGYLLLPKALTGIDAKIAVALGRRFPMIGAHKVLAAYACLMARLITGQFDPKRHRAVWPSTGNYCRGGVAISRILGCRGVAVLPAGMSQERFDWLANWVADPTDIVRTPGTESNVKEIYDKCHELARDPANVILNQFSEFANYLGHYLCTGKALERIFEDVAGGKPMRLAAYVSGTGSAGTLGAGDRLKERFGTKIVAMEPVECPTMLYNGYGEHNIQGIGDKHVPLIQNCTNMDMVVGVSDKSCDRLNVLFNTKVGRAYLADRAGIAPALIESLDAFGLSGIGNVLGAIKVAKRLGLGEDDVVMTVATDSAALYTTEIAKAEKSLFGGTFDTAAAAATFARDLAGLETDHLLELGAADRKRIFNLGYFTWVEQQGTTLEDFDRRKNQAFWRGLHDLLPGLDAMTDDFNGRAGVNRPG